MVSAEEKKADRAVYLVAAAAADSGFSQGQRFRGEMECHIKAGKEEEELFMYSFVGTDYIGEIWTCCCCNAHKWLTEKSLCPPPARKLTGESIPLFAGITGLFLRRQQLYHIRVGFRGNRIGIDSAQLFRLSLVRAHVTTTTTLPFPEEVVHDTVSPPRPCRRR